MIERFEQWGSRLEKSHEILPKHPAKKPSGDQQPVNEAERKLRRMLLVAGFSEGEWQEPHPLPRPLVSTRPDVTYRDPDEADRKICIYLDGLSGHIHGNPETRERDIQIRAELRLQDHDVIEITAADLDDQQAMTRHFRKLARALSGRDKAAQVKDDAPQWFAARMDEAPKPVKAATDDRGVVLPFRRVAEPKPEDMFRTCVPVFSLKAAAGNFSEGQAPEPEGWAEIETQRALTRDLFVAQVVGKSMEPRIPDGAWCLFTRFVGGSRHGRILIVQHREIYDPETGGRYTVKEYRRPPQAVGGHRVGRSDCAQAGESGVRADSVGGRRRGCYGGWGVAGGVGLRGGQRALLYTVLSIRNLAYHHLSLDEKRAVLEAKEKKYAQASQTRQCRPGAKAGTGAWQTS